MILRIIGFFVFLVSVVSIQSQTFADGSLSETTLEKVIKAKVYIALKNYAAAVYELEQIRRQTKDETIRNLVNSMLMNCYFEQRDYRRARKLLEDSFSDKSDSLQNYFSVAAQALKGIRTQAERYKALGLSFNDKKLPDEAVNDIEKLRELSELIIQQSKSIITPENSSVLLALVEESTKIRSTLARDEYDYRYWKDIAEDLRQDMTKSVKVLDAVAESEVSRRDNLRDNLREEKAEKSSEKSENPKTENKGFRSSFTFSFQNEEENYPLLQLGSLIEYATKRISPVYPLQAKRLKISGVVRVEVLIDENGKVALVERVSGPSLLQPAAVEAIKNWEFKPFVRNGKAVKVRGFVDFNFSITE